MLKLLALSTTGLQPALDTLGLVWEALQARSERLALERQRYIDVFAFSPRRVPDHGPGIVAARGTLPRNRSGC